MLQFVRRTAQLNLHVSDSYFQWRKLAYSLE